MIDFAFVTKFYVLFSFLFGYGLSVQMARAAARGTTIVPRFLRRLIGLLLLGIAHALLLYTGDILVTYAILGLVLLLLRNASDATLLRLATFLIAASVIIFAIIGVAFVFLSAGPGAGDAGEAASEAARITAAYRGTPAAVIMQRAREYPGTLGFALLGQGPTALAMFLLGLWTGRRRLFANIDAALPLLRRIRLVGLSIGVPGGIIWATYSAINGFRFEASFLFAAAVDFATAPFLTAVYATTIVLLYRDERWRRRLAPLGAVGRLALSNYLLQSLIGAFLFTGYGLGLFGQIGSAVGLLLSATIYAAQIPLSVWWVRQFAFGPAEWLLRSFTYTRWQPFRLRATGD